VALQLKRRGITRVRPLHGGLEGWMTLGFPVRELPAPALPAELKPQEVTK
jgi:3-mercaptopyruvate sulfurtransferase SseA